MEVTRVNRRTASVDTEFSTREADGKRYIEGYFAVFNSFYELWDGAAETIDQGAFDLGRDTDVRALANHDTTLVLGRTTAGTLTLSVDERGLYGVVELNEADQDAVNLYERVKRRDVTQCSFGFDILDDLPIEENGRTVWHLRSVKLYEVSVCTFPAYEETGVQARKNELETIKKRKAEAWRLEMLKKLKGDTNA